MGNNKPSVDKDAALQAAVASKLPTTGPNAKELSGHQDLSRPLTLAEFEEAPGLLLVSLLLGGEWLCGLLSLTFLDPSPSTDVWLWECLVFSLWNANIVLMGQATPHRHHSPTSQATRLCVCVPDVCTPPFSPLLGGLTPLFFLFFFPREGSFAWRDPWGQQACLGLPHMSIYGNNH